MKTGVEKYINNLKNYPTLSLEKETELAIKSFNGDMEARNKLIKGNLKLVVHIAKDYFWLGHHYGWQHNDDIVGVGNRELCEAARRYDPSKAERFEDYASSCLRGKYKTHISKEMKHGANSIEYKEDENEEDDFMSPKYTIDGRDSVLTELTHKERLFLIGNTLQSMNRGLNHTEKYILNHIIMADIPQTHLEASIILKICERTIRNIDSELKTKIKQIMQTMPEFNGEFSGGNNE